MNILRRFLPREHEYRISYSQCGEDLIVAFVFQGLRMSNWRYLDIGAHHPTEISNTYLFYSQGHDGVCVEPDPTLFAEIAKVRVRDICLNVGVGANEETSADFFVMTSRSLNTFSKSEAEHNRDYGEQKIESVIRVPLVSINTLVEQYFEPHPNLISLDIEGLDFDVLQTFDFERFRPEVFCIETLTYTTNKTERKKTEIIEFMNSRGYFSYADTFINTIFVRQDAWAAR